MHVCWWNSLWHSWRYKYCKCITEANTFLNSWTKQQLTVYLSEYVISEFEWLAIYFVVSYDSTTKTNWEGLSAEILHCLHEEADIHLIIYCWKMARKNPFNQCIVYCPDINVFLYLIFHYPWLPTAIIFRKCKDSDLRSFFLDRCYKALGSCRANALLGFHKFTGYDQTGRFMRKSETF